jgi:Protein of unknown function (DUF2971)
MELLTVDTLVLYKYRAISDRSIDALRTGSMWFSLPAKLNDTFEFSLPIFISMSAAELVEHYEKRFKIDAVAPEILGAMMRHGGSGSFEVTDKSIQKFLSASGENRSLFLISIIHFLRAQGLSTLDIVKKLGLTSDNELVQRLERDLRNAYTKNQGIGQGYGVLSLSARRDDPQMWAHYADSCRGMCIGVTFDVDELVKSVFIPLWVEYADALPVLDASQFFSRDQENVMDMLKVFCATKHTAWMHEAECRLVSMEGDRAFKLPGRISEVILGEKIDVGAVNRIADALKGQDGIKLLKMMREPGTWNYRAYNNDY